MDVTEKDCERAIEIARLLDVELLPWQEYVLTLMLANCPELRRVTVSIPRRIGHSRLLAEAEVEARLLREPTD